VPSSGNVGAAEAVDQTFLNINGKSNAVFVDTLQDVAGVLDAFKAAAASGELDKAIALATKARSS
jgi:hypothetical protein